MARKSISVRGTTYDKIKEHCEKKGLSLSSFIEDLCVGFLERKDALKAVVAAKKGNGSDIDTRKVRF